MDQCDPATGGCMNPRVPLGDVPGLQFGSGTMLAWPAVPGANSYNTYRGTIPMHLLGSRPPPQPIYDQTCFEMGDANGDGPLVSSDPAVPPPGTAFYYLVTQVTGCGEGPAGRDSDGTVIPNSFPCPTGP